MLLYDSTLRVPLVMSGPSLGAGTRDQPVSLANLAATMVASAGVPVPHGMQLPSLLSAEKPGEVYAETEYPRSAGWHALTALADDRWKLIVSSERELYDLASDPGETRNVAEWKTPVADAMSNALAAVAKGPLPQTLLARVAAIQASFAGEAR